MRQGKKINVIYTSDVHGKISTFDFIFEHNKGYGLSRFSTFVKSLKTPYILIDNGDVLQGSPLMDFAREKHLENPVSKSFNLLNYDYYTLGNHDFNYGLDVLSEFVESNHSTLLCCNILDQNDQPVYKPYDIKTIDGIRIGFIGALTQYIPVWEKPEHILGFKFVSAYEQTKKYVDMIKDQVDAIVVFYHGGYEKNLETGHQIGRPSTENEGYALFQIPEVNVLLCGHQHKPTVYKKDLKITIETSNQAKDFGVVDLSFDANNQLIAVDGSLINNDYEIDEDFENEFKDIINQTNSSLDEIIGEISCEMKMTDPFESRKDNHLFFQFINYIQKEITGADISLASLPNDAIGISKNVTKRELAANFVYVNALVKMEITGKILKAALEKNAEYFNSINGEIIINDDYIFPKLEHYNFDIYDGITYTYKISNPKGQKVIELLYQGKPVTDDQIFEVCMNSYRANGGGDYFMFTEGKIIESFDISYVDLMVEYIKNHPHLKMVHKNQFKIIY